MKSKALIASTLALAMAFAFVSSAAAQSASSLNPTDGTSVTQSTTTTTGTVDTSGTTTPGLPNTGFGGGAPMSIALVLSSGLIAVAGTLYALRRYA